MGERAAQVIKGAAAALLYIAIYISVMWLIQLEAIYFEADVVNASGLTAVISAAAAFAIYRVTFYLRGIDKKDMYTLSPPSIISSLFALTLAAGFRMVTTVYILWAENIKILSESMNSAFDPQYNFETMTNFAAMMIVLATCFFAPLFEEILFRGIVMKELGRAIPPWAVITIQGLLFGIVHFVLVQSIFAAVFGIILGYVYYKTKNLSITAIAHIAFNISSPLELKNTGSGLCIGLIGALITALSVVMLARKSYAK